MSIRPKNDPAGEALEAWADQRGTENPLTAQVQQSRSGEKRGAKMPLANTFELVIQTIRECVSRKFSNTRTEFLALRPSLICSAGEYVRSAAGTWYLSVLVSSDSDEVSATVGAANVDGHTTVAADICIGAEVIFELKESLSGAKDEDLARLVRLLEQYLRSLPELLDAALAELDRRTPPS